MSASVNAQEDQGSFVTAFVGEEGVLAKYLQDTAGVDIIEHRSGWVYFRGEISQRSRKELLDIKGIWIFDHDIIVKSIHVEDELNMNVDHSIHVFELGDWVMPDLGTYKGDVGCIVATHDWGYDVAFIPWYISSITDNYAQAPPLVVAMRDEAHTLSGPGLAGTKPLIEDSLQILELSAKSVMIAGDIPVYILQMFASPCAHVDTNKPNSLQAPDNTRKINVWRNSVTSTNPPKAFAALAPDKITDRMYTGETPWRGVNVIVLPSNDRSVTTAHTYKGQVGTVLDILLKQLGPSGIRVCVHLSRTYRAAGGFADIWLDYDEVVEESTGLPLRYCLPLCGDQIAFMPS
ncbi:hypothetical protein IW262DRAFT_1459249 [Armillaria fumosa]|nr:hypothetical protein IW262DRAFT_1459249 [Armillaria fumosa]